MSPPALELVVSTVSRATRSKAPSKVAGSEMNDVVVPVSGTSVSPGAPKPLRTTVPLLGVNGSGLSEVSLQAPTTSSAETNRRRSMAGWVMGKA
jgi:hypothetical protein